MSGAQSDCFKGYVLREMGLHAHLLEPGWCSYELLPLYPLSRVSRPIYLSLESTGTVGARGNVPVYVLGVGYSQQPEEHVPRSTEGPYSSSQVFPSASMEIYREPRQDPHKDGRSHSLQWLV